ncbi:MAG: hypothetical protein ACE37B_22825 [Ilumatobacter sp.]|uniref:hypothetical protein n=1 Tax=Ilumatobacter sp. TaxID=1967498 RepID=UPI00391C80B8
MTAGSNTERRIDHTDTSDAPTGTGPSPGPGVSGELLTIGGVDHYRLDGVEEMAPFLMTVVSESDLWMFVSSNGALTAGRIDADHALFPYGTDDRIHRAAGTVGPVTVLARMVDGTRELWQPFAATPTPGCRRSIAKSVLGNRLVFDEHHPAWGLTFRAVWEPSDVHGWVRTTEIHRTTNVHCVDPDATGVDATPPTHADTTDTLHTGTDTDTIHTEGLDIEVLDGLLDVMPAGVDAYTEQIRSNLVDAYKRSEIGPWGTLAVFSLEALISDRAEPMEALTATVVWSSGLPDTDDDLGRDVLLDATAVDDMLRGRPSATTPLVTGRPGAYLLRGTVRVTADAAARWTIVADTGLDHAAVAATARLAVTDGALALVADDVTAGSRRLEALLGDADGAQRTGDDVADAHHLSNTLFNCMRGGVFPFGHDVPISDLAAFVDERNRDVAERHRAWFDRLHERLDERPDERLDGRRDVADVRAAALDTGDPDLVRLVLEYLPLTFSRRHGDPSRPWNRFSIKVRDEHGDALLTYEGNWRDIFQNWEALLQSYPAWFANVVAKFVNATTIEGYNPYRISRDGIDWEVPDPDDPWSHIGYWGDHQIVYLMRLLEMWNRYEPTALAGWLDSASFVFADVPYRLADHDDMVRDPRDTITYDEQHAAAIADREVRLGADGRLLVDPDGALMHASLLEKLVVPALAKLTNFVPDGGLWLNTQRPEWNDANNALAGPGLSMVTLYHLRRYLSFIESLVDTQVDTQVDTGHDAGLDARRVPMTSSVATWLDDIRRTLHEHPTGPLGDTERRTVVDRLGRSGEAHRDRVRSWREVGRTQPTNDAPGTGPSDRASAGVGSERVDVALADIRDLCSIANAHLDAAIDAARRPDGLFHSYNRISFPSDDRACVDHLGPMLEGQVAVLSSGALDVAERLAVVDALFASEMYRDDLGTFLLYPPTELRPFLERNTIAPVALERLRSSERGDSDAVLDALTVTDGDGVVHFRADLVNARALEAALDRAGVDDPARRAVVAEVYEATFDHDSFTGRSGSMYGYEGIGSVYWHMVAKLLLAVQETYWELEQHDEHHDDVAPIVADAYRRIRAGLGYQKTPAEFGAIPTDCYSHTPSHAGAQQPGMTGQVKEEVLTRFGELGFHVADGRLRFAPGLISPDEVFPTTTSGLAPSSLTVCGVPMTIEIATDDITGDITDDTSGEHDGTDVVLLELADGTSETHTGSTLDADRSRDVFGRTGTIARARWIVGIDRIATWRQRTSSTT